MTRLQTSRRSLMIYSLGAVLLVFIGLMAVVEADEAGKRRQLTTTAIYATNSQVSRIFLSRTRSFRGWTLTPTATLTPTGNPTARK